MNNKKDKKWIKPTIYKLGVSLTKGGATASNNENSQHFVFGATKS